MGRLDRNRSRIFVESKEEILCSSIHTGEILNIGIGEPSRFIKYLKLKSLFGDSFKVIKLKDNGKSKRSKSFVSN